MAGRIAGIDVLKVFAVLFVLNSHMGACYGEYAVLATGGAIGDALFFFLLGIYVAARRLAGFSQLVQA